MSDHPRDSGFVQVWFILVQDRTVVGWYTYREIAARDRAVICWRETRQQPVRVYAVASEHYLPPTVGTTVDVELLGWKEIAIAPIPRDAEDGGVDHSVRN